jgi:transmembrane sensor
LLLLYKVNIMEEKYPLAQWLNDELKDNEVTDFEKDTDLETYSKIKKYSAQLTTSTFDEDKMLSEILKSKKQNTTKVIPMNTNWMYKVAAVLVLGFGMLFLFQNFSDEKQIAANGSKTSFSLPDASEVVLNSGSEIEYKKANWDRNVKLCGEAFFKVAKGKRFEVHTNLGKVAVLGTQFDVKARENRFDVTCYEGRVQVNYDKVQILLTEGQRVIFENGKQTTAIVAAEKPDWLSNKIAFDKENLQQIVDEIERNYDVKIKVNLFDTSGLFTGKMPSDNLEVALDIISRTYQLKITKINSKSIIFEKK